MQSHSPIYTHIHKSTFLHLSAFYLTLTPMNTSEATCSCLPRILWRAQRSSRASNHQPSEQ